MNQDTRPVNLDLTKFAFPLPALASITHRVAGMVLFAGILFLLWVLERSLVSAEGFNAVKEMLTAPLSRVITWVLLSALIYHLIAGIKHLCLDLGMGETLEGGRLSAWLVIIVSLVFIVLAGVWIFQ